MMGMMAELVAAAESAEEAAAGGKEEGDDDGTGGSLPEDKELLEVATREHLTEGLSRECAGVPDSPAGAGANGKVHEPSPLEALAMGAAVAAAADAAAADAAAGPPGGPSLRARAFDLVPSVQERGTCLLQAIYPTAAAVKAKATQVRDGVGSIAADPAFQISVVSAAGGAVALGAGGGAVGGTTGGALGAFVGLAQAPFTFGLSIPIGAAFGGGIGLAIGTAIGSTAGAVSGGAAGYSAYAKRDDICACAGYVKSKVVETRELVQGTSAAALGRAVEAAESTKAHACASAGYVVDKAVAVKSRLVGQSGTGGTEAAD